MTHITEHHNDEKEIKKDRQDNYLILAGIIVSSVIISGSFIYASGMRTENGNIGTRVNSQQQNQNFVDSIENEVLPPRGVELPVVWGDLGNKLVQTGVIDEAQFTELYRQGNGVFPDEYKELLLGKKNGRLKITEENSGYILNLFWALGLGNKNEILEKGEMTLKQYGGDPGVFASTGGWTIAKGNSMDHYSAHNFFTLTPEQQALVEKISKTIFRPCCNNSTHFPDCNHGMAMLGLLELMASQNVSEQDMYKAALTVNSYWFPDTYITIAKYMKDNGVAWDSVSPREILGAEYSSASGYSQVSAKTGQSQLRGNSGCDVSTGDVNSRRQQSGCGL